MKTYSPVERHVTMEEDADGEWTHLEDHLAVLAENALKMKGLEVKIEKLERHCSLLDEQFFYKKEGDEWMVYIAGAWFVSAAFKSGKLYQSDLISVEILRV